MSWDDLSFCAEHGVGVGVGLTRGQVCKEWHRKCFDGQLWQTLDASEFYNRIPVGQLAQLICKTGPFVKRLNLR